MLLTLPNVLGQQLGSLHRYEVDLRRGAQAGPYERLARAWRPVEQHPAGLVRE